MRLNIFYIVQLWLIAGAHSQAISKFTQSITLYGKQKGQGPSVTFNNNVPDLAVNEFKNKAFWVCVTGVLILYQEPEYNDAGGKLVEWIFGKDNLCVLLKAISLKASSLRFAGDVSDYTISSLTLYTHTFFEGEEVYITDTMSLPTYPWTNHTSLIVTGRSNWTIWDQPGYKGYKVCLYIAPSPDFTPMLVTDIRKQLRLYHGWIRSARRGCA